MKPEGNQLENERDKKPFDSTVCFTFFRTWVETIFRLEQAGQKEEAYDLFKAIANYCLYGIEPEFEAEGQATLSLLWPIIEGEADRSISNRKRAFAKEELTEKEQAIIAECIKSPELSIRSVANRLDVSKSYVDRVKKKYHTLINKGIEEQMREQAPAEENKAVPSVGQPVPLEEQNTVPSVGQNTVPYNEKGQQEISVLNEDDGELPF